jgi:REP element-mobilizing transposase RayT
MRRTKCELYVHLVWTTWDREPLITPQLQRAIYRTIQEEVQKLGCSVLALDGMPDHTHLGVKVPATLTIAALAKQVKGVSSQMVNEVFKPTSPFRWQGGYGAFTVSRWDVDEIVQYIRNQTHHHTEQTLIAEYEEIFIDDV